jgi:hypothetical protein
MREQLTIEVLEALVGFDTRFAQPLGGGVVDREDLFDKSQEKRDPVLLPIEVVRRSSAAHDLVELSPFGQHRLARQQEKRSMKVGLPLTKNLALSGVRA